MKILLDQYKTSRRGHYIAKHTLSVVCVNGKYFGHSKVDEGFQCSNTFYGREGSSTANLDRRTDGYDTPEQALERLKRRFDIVAVDRRGNAVRKE